MPKNEPGSPNRFLYTPCVIASLLISLRIIPIYALFRYCSDTLILKLLVFICTFLLSNLLPLRVLWIWVIPMPELQEIFRAIQPGNLSPEQKKAFFAISTCRTEVLGSHVDNCESCGHIHISYNSCRNRHCPKCQYSKQQEWVDAQLVKLLPVSYFHVVFTLPKELNPIVLQNQSILYSILMKSAADTLLELAKDPKHLGAQIGVTEVLHTWGQNLAFHPHVHCLVPGGGLSQDGLNFIPSRKKFFIPVKVISDKFRGKFLDRLKVAWLNGKVKFYHSCAELALANNFLNLLSTLYQKDWVVNCKKPFKSPWYVVSYIGRYTHRVAISNSRILDFDGSTVLFRWKDYKDHNRVKLMRLEAAEFIRRFLLHVLPSGFTRIRHYGLLASKNVRTKLVRCQKLAGKRVAVPKVTKLVNTCPLCGGVMAFACLFNKPLAEP